jgi:hypothetical protein
MILGPSRFGAIWILEAFLAPQGPAPAQYSLLSLLRKGSCLSGSGASESEHALALRVEMQWNKRQHVRSTE